MATKIRLARHGAKKKPFYRVIVTDSENPRNGRFIEIVGTYNPFKEKPRAEFKKERLDYWIGQGAIPTSIVKNLIREVSVS